MKEEEYTVDTQEVEEVNPELKQMCLDIIQDLEEAKQTKSPVVFKFMYNEKPNWTIALGFKYEPHDTILH